MGLSSSQSQAGSFALVLGELDGNRRLPIIIGMFEAQAIAIEIEKIEAKRPMTHDLFKSFAEKFNFYIDEIIIDDLREGVFYAKIICSDGIKSVKIDSRPSDAIAIGLRFNVPVFTYDNILSEAGIVLTDNPEEEEPAEKPAKRLRKKSFAEQLQDFASEQLHKMLEEALNDEDYEKAAIIRDELNKRN